MRDGLTLTDPMPLPLPLSPDSLPTLNPNPEALLDFTCRALSQAGVQPSIVHLGTGQGDQLLLAPHVHPSCHPTFWSDYSSLGLSSPSCSRGTRAGLEVLVLTIWFSFLSVLGLAFLGVHKDIGMGIVSLPTRHTKEDLGDIWQLPTGQLQCRLLS